MTVAAQRIAAKAEIRSTVQETDIIRNYFQDPDTMAALTEFMVNYEPKPEHRLLLKMLA
jgi:hypothetical protein